MPVRTSRPPRPPLVAGVLAGAAGTAAMTLTGRAHRVAVARRRGIRPADLTEVLDYDDSEHVVIAAATVVEAVTGLVPHTPGQRRALFLLTHWGYGSAVGVVHAALRRGLGDAPGGLAFFLFGQVMALGLFPVLGDTPPPWRWRRRLLVTSFAQHAVYAAAVAGADAVLGAATGGRSRRDPRPRRSR